MSNAEDAYQTISEISEGFYKEKGSKFLAFAIPCNSITAAKEHIENFRKEHHNACHVCFAWRFGTESYSDRYSDDGEPNNSAGKPIFGQIISYEVTNVLVAVVRYYGGTNLGVGGLITAYKTAAKAAFEKATIRTKYITTSFELTHNYEDTGVVMSTLNKLGANITGQEFENNRPNIQFYVNRKDGARVLKSFAPYPNVTVEKTSSRKDMK